MMDVNSFSSAPRSSPRGPATRRSVALVTCRVLPEPDPDQEPLLAALREAGLQAEFLAWDDPAAGRPGAFDLCVLRSSWNYFQEPEGFLAWCEEAAGTSRLLNPLPAVRWNLHKRYLLELEAAGVPVVPTVLLERGAAADLPGLIAARGWPDVVVKPAVSAASFLTRRFRPGEAAAGQDFLAALLAERDALVQPFLPAAEGSGERALVFIDGPLSHAVRKSPRLSGDDERVSEAVPIAPAEREVAERAMAVGSARVGLPLLYGRVDLLADEAGALRVSELELIEPSLFLVQSPPALERLVRAIVRDVR
jgi:O-ureido-D-serine cyclo-ligase